MVKLATTALHAAQQDDWDAVKRNVTALSDLDDGSLMSAILAWCDTCLASQGISMDGTTPVQVKWREQGTEDEQGADDVRPAVRWAGQLINARAADDDAAFIAHMRAIPEGAEFGHHVMTLLQCIAVTLKTTAGAA